MIHSDHYEIRKENLSKHELIGLSVVVSASTDPRRIGTAGSIVDETMHTFVIRSLKEGKEIVVPKKECAFTFDLDGEKVTLQGKEIEKKSVERLK